MNGLVIDASIALGWCFEDEADALGDAALRRVVAGGADVPGIFPLEVANVLAAAERRGRIRPAESARFLALLDALPLRVDAQTPTRATREVLLLARAHALSVYDAAYLELATRTGAALATRDARLGEVARSLGLAWTPTERPRELASRSDQPR